VFFDQCRTGDPVQVARTLDGGGIDVDTPDPADGGKTALMVAGERGHVDVVRLLLDWQASPNVQERNGGHTALHLIARHGRVDADHLEVVRVLLHHGADPNIAGRFDITPLHRACYNRSMDLIRLLIDGGSRLSRQDIGWTALRRVCDVGHLEVIEMLVRHGADPHAPEGDGKSCVEWARAGGHEDVLAVLERCTS
jgi:ankyrin repeat protein